MIIDNDPPIERHISVPRDMSQLSCSLSLLVSSKLSLTAFHSYVLPYLPSKANLLITLFLQPARVTAHNTPTLQFPNRTTVLIKLEKSIGSWGVIICKPITLTIFCIQFIFMFLVVPAQQGTTRHMMVARFELLSSLTALNTLHTESLIGIWEFKVRHLSQTFSSAIWYIKERWTEQCSFVDHWENNVPSYIGTFLFSPTLVYLSLYETGHWCIWLPWRSHSLSTLRERLLCQREPECCVALRFTNYHPIVRRAERRLKHCDCYTQTTILLKSSKYQT